MIQVIIFLCLARLSSSQDAPDDQNACNVNNIRNADTRYYTLGQGDNCDNGLAEGWYKWENSDGTPARIPTVCIQNNFGNTHLPMRLELSGRALPNVNVTLRAHVCTSYNVLGKWDCCVLRREAFVRNCGEFYVYYLEPVDRCPVAYVTQRDEENNPTNAYTAKTGDAGEPDNSSSSSPESDNAEEGADPTVATTSVSTTASMFDLCGLDPDSVVYDCHDNRSCVNQTNSDGETVVLIKCAAARECGRLCDNLPDCADDSDELDSICRVPRSCSENLISCPDRSRCSTRCNGISECDDGWDELNCDQGPDGEIAVDNVTSTTVATRGTDNSTIPPGSSTIMSVTTSQGDSSSASSIATPSTTLSSTSDSSLSAQSKSKDDTETTTSTPATTSTSSTSSSPSVTSVIASGTTTVLSQDSSQSTNEISQTSSGPENITSASVSTPQHVNLTDMTTDSSTDEQNVTTITSVISNDGNLTTTPENATQSDYSTQSSSSTGSSVDISQISTTDNSSSGPLTIDTHTEGGVTSIQETENVTETASNYTVSTAPTGQQSSSLPTVTQSTSTETERTSIDLSASSGETKTTIQISTPLQSTRSPPTTGVIVTSTVPVQEISTSGVTTTPTISPSSRAVSQSTGSETVGTSAQPDDDDVQSTATTETATEMPETNTVQVSNVPSNDTRSVESLTTVRSISVPSIPDYIAQSSSTMSPISLSTTTTTTTAPPLTTTTTVSPTTTATSTSPPRSSSTTSTTRFASSSSTTATSRALPSLPPIASSTTTVLSLSPSSSSSSSVSSSSRVTSSPSPSAPSSSRTFSPQSTPLTSSQTIQTPVSTSNNTNATVHAEDGDSMNIIGDNPGLFVFLIATGVVLFGVSIFGLVGLCYFRRLRTWSPEMSFQDAYAESEKTMPSEMQEKQGVDSPIPDVDILRGEEIDSPSKASTLVCGPTPDRLNTLDETKDLDTSGQDGFLSTPLKPPALYADMGTGQGSNGFHGDVLQEGEGVVPINEWDQIGNRNMFPWIEAAEDTKL